LNEYKGRQDLNVKNITNAPIKEPKNEAETALLLQAMISSEHPGIDFVIGEYKSQKGVDLTVEYESKGIHNCAWVELVWTLEKLFKWYHPLEGIHKIVCWDLGNVAEKEKFNNGSEAILSKRSQGRYSLSIGDDNLDIYVLKEIIQKYS